MAKLRKDKMKRRIQDNRAGFKAVKDARVKREKRAEDKRMRDLANDAPMANDYWLEK